MSVGAAGWPVGTVPLPAGTLGLPVAGPWPARSTGLGSSLPVSGVVIASPAPRGTPEAFVFLRPNAWGIPEGFVFLRPNSRGIPEGFVFLRPNARGTPEGFAMNSRGWSAAEPPVSRKGNLNPGGVRQCAVVGTTRHGPTPPG